MSATDPRLLRLHPADNVPRVSEGSRAFQALLRLHPADNVLTVVRALKPGERILVEGIGMAVTTSLPLGHKVAARAIGTGDKIIKYGAPIGSATCEIAAGEHVHTHNVRSDYLPTFARGEGQHYTQ